MNEAAIIKMFADIADEGNPEIATMEGRFTSIFALKQEFLIPTYTLISLIFVLQ